VTAGVCYKGIKEHNPDFIYLEFLIQDTGIGIPEDRREEIFDRFLQLENPYTKKYSGTGLGLAIVKHLVEILGGTITLESKVDTGSTFRLTLPFKTVGTNLTQLEEKTCLQLNEQRYNVLLVEDNLMTLTIIKKMLTHHFKYLILDEAENGEQVLNKIKEKGYDLILMDIQMPIMNGFECVKRIRELEKLNSIHTTKHTPIIAISAFTMPHEIMEGKETGLDGFIIKPINEHHLIKKVQQTLYPN
jgi:CheY-like chemotaxis protein